VTRPTHARAAEVAASQNSRALRWTFRRDQEIIVCELSLSPDYREYELRIQPPWNPAGTSSESFDDARAAFERHAAIERILISEGWSLESFESAESR
jgi:hypothetical protein